MQGLELSAGGSRKRSLTVALVKHSGPGTSQGTHALGGCLSRTGPPRGT